MILCMYIFLYRKKGHGNVIKMLIIMTSRWQVIIIVSSFYSIGLPKFYTVYIYYIKKCF